MKKIILYIFTLLSLPALAQQRGQFSQYLFNGVVINPAYAGSRETINLNGLYRKQWNKVNGAPTTQTFSADMPLFFNKAGVGLYFIHDELGAQYQNSLFGAFSYRVKLSSTARLAFGVSGGFNQVGMDGSKLTTDQPNDPAVAQSRVSQTKPDMQAGLYFNTNRFFAGLSMGDIFSGRRNLMTPNYRKQFYLTSGFVAKLSESFKVRPSFMIKEDFKAPTNTDLTAFIIFKDRIWLGSSYRTRILHKESLDKDLFARDAVVFMVELFPIENLRLGYGYDLTLTQYKNFPTHEFSIGYNFNKKSGSAMLSPRYF